jgi:hypothetical protein
MNFKDRFNLIVLNDFDKYINNYIQYEDLIFKTKTNYYIFSNIYLFKLLSVL